MAEVFGPLGQVAPAATTLTAAYTVPAARYATISTVTICNSTALKVKVRLAVAKGGAGDDIKQYLLWDQEIASKSTFLLTIGIALAAGDIIRVYATATNVAFNIFGVEIG
jgi:hypothetical protein